MKITGWTSWDDIKYERFYPESHEEYLQVEEAIASELRNNGYKFTGDYHQNGNFGVPILDNGKIYQCSQRLWGEIMVKAYPNEIDNSDDMGYTVWAWDAQEEMKLPNNDKYSGGLELPHTWTHLTYQEAIGKNPFAINCKEIEKGN